MAALARAFPGAARDVGLTAAKSVSFSNYGEDLVLSRMFKLPQAGFYVDVGANHPIVASNTFRLDLMGWSGVAFEPNPDLARLYPRLRPACRVVERAVGEARASLEFIRFNVDQCDTFDPELARMARARGMVEIGREMIEVERLDVLLAEHVGEREVDVMSIDVEGFDLQVLRSNDWARWTPAILLVEDHLPFGARFDDSEIARFLSQKGYAVAARVHFTTFFAHRERARAFAW
jgi:FkbM family methyltransferase